MIYDYAKRFLNAGIAVIPIAYKTKLPSGQWKQFQKVLPTEQQLRSWFMRPSNYGVVTGWIGLVVIDFDDIDTFLKWQRWSARRPGRTSYIASHALHVRTSRGMHIYTRMLEPVANSAMPGVDIRGRGGMVIGPGSIHPSGSVYQALQDIWEFPLIETLSDILPAWLLTTQQLPSSVVRPIQIQRPPECNDPWESAMRIPSSGAREGLVDEIKGKIGLLDFFPGAHDTSNDGRYKMDTCPFHDDRHPSFWIDTEQQICSCHSCKMKPMDVINLYARLHGMHNDEAIAAMRVML